MQKLEILWVGKTFELNRHIGSVFDQRDGIKLDITPFASQKEMEEPENPSRSNIWEP